MTIQPRESNHAGALVDDRVAPAAAAPILPNDVLHGGFLRQAAFRPTADAVIWEDAAGRADRLTYAGLRAWAARVAAWIDAARIAETVPPLVAIILPKGWEQVAGVLGASWAGVPYVPVDATWPAARVHDVLTATACRLALCRAEDRVRLGLADTIDTLDLATWQEAGEPPEAAAARWSASQTARSGSGPAASCDLAYVIYTSGSTGTPKGVMMEHGATSLTIAEVVRRWQIGPADRVLALSSLSFDLSVFDVFGLLAAGGALVLPRDTQRRDPAAWLRLAAAHAVTVWNSVPALLHMAIEQLESRGAGTRWPGPLRLALLSGDWIPLSLPDRLRAFTDAALVSLGGATEAAIWSIAYDLAEATAAERAEWRSVPYGRALAGQTVQVLRGVAGDADSGDTPAATAATGPDAAALTPCPPWVTGRLFIAGGGLARGYWGNPDDTRRRFVVHPTTGARLYDTGDLGRVRPDGVIELLGRADRQVKVQGYRVELGEIEATLTRHPAVAAAAVNVATTPSGSRQLFAYVVPRQPGAVLDLPAIRTFLLQTLPSYMVPLLQVLPALPLNANDKVDVNALPPPEFTAPAPAVPADSPELAILQRVAQDVLKVPIGPDENLLELGVTSVDILTIVTRAEEELRIEVDIEAFFETPTLRDILVRHRATQS